MPFITIDEEQARVVLESAGEVEVRDRDGNHLGYVARGTRQVRERLPTLATLDELATPPVKEWVDDKGWQDYDPR